jgi:aryl-alcohol dehydrogenase-like predicted oxidoreductase
MDDSGKKQGASRRYIVNAVEESLSRLQTDWIDLYQLHTPDPLTPIEETLRALDDLVGQGKVRYIGCSNLPAWQVVDSQWISKTDGLEAFISCQDEYSLLQRDVEKELIPAAKEHGLLTGKYKRNQPMPEGARLTKTQALADRYMTDKNWEIVEKLEAFSTERSHTMLELAFSWLASQPTVSSVIAGATKPEQVEQNVKAADWQMSPEELDQIRSILNA